jgi:hypothetical protein
MPALELIKATGSAAGLMALAWNIVEYRLEHRTSLKVSATPEARDRRQGVSVKIHNRSHNRPVQVKDLEVLHYQGLFKRRGIQSAGPFVEPRTPWTIEPEKDKDAWIPRNGIDGSDGDLKDPAWDLSKPIRVRAVLSVGRARRSRRCKIEAT